LKREDGPELFAAQWLVLTIATILLDPNFFLQDMVILVPAAIAFICDAPVEHRRRTFVFGGVLWLLFGLGLVPSGAFRVNVASLAMAAWLFVLVWSYRSANSRQRADAESVDGRQLSQAA
jgi:hypothetical protein